MAATASSLVACFFAAAIGLRVASNTREAKSVSKLLRRDDVGPLAAEFETQHPFTRQVVAVLLRGGERPFLRRLHGETREVLAWANGIEFRADNISRRIDRHSNSDLDVSGNR